MASSRKEIQQITDREIEKVNIASLADRPTSGSRYGVGDFTAQKLKERFDAFPALIKERFNAIVQALNSSDAPKYITLDGSIAGIDNLYDFLLLFCEKTAGEKNISDYIHALYTDIQNAQASSKTLQDIINDMASWLVKLKEESAVHSGKISDAEKRLDKNDERLEDIEDYINDMVTVENSNAYHVLVPKDSRSKAKVLSVGGMTYKDGNTLKNAKTTAIKSRGAQLIPFPYETSSLTQDGLTFMANSDGTITINGTHTGTTNANFYMLGRESPQLSIQAGTYTLSAFPKGYVGTSRLRALVYVSGNALTSFEAGPSSTTMTLDSSVKLVFVLYVKPGETLSNLIVKPMLNVGTTAAPFEPFKPAPIDTITIPESVQNLEGYGLGLNKDYNNYFEFVGGRVLYHNVCPTFVFNGTESWKKQSTNSVGLANYYLDIPNMVKGIGLANKYVYDLSTIADAKTEGIFNTNVSLFVRTFAYQTVDEFKAHLAELYASGDPLTVVVAFETPIVTDISSLFTADNEIKVSENGYLEFENEYQYPVPSSIEWNIYSSHKVAFEHANTVGNPHRTTAAEVGAYSIPEADAKFVLLEEGKVPSRMLPSYVDDTIEGYIDDSGDFVVTERAPDGNLLPAKTSGKIYVDTNKNKTYRWSGSIYVEMASGPLILGETAETAYRGDRGKIAFDHSQTKGNPHGTTMDEILPVTASDNGKFLRVVDGKWSAVTIATAEGGSF